MDRTEQLMAASKSGTLLDVVYDVYRENPEERKDLLLAITTLHNNRQINLVAEFDNLRNRTGKGPNFFLTRRIFELVLPHLDAPLGDVMHCVLRLHREAGHDIAAGTILSAYVAFCDKDRTRPLEALKLIESDHDQLADLLPATVAAGSRTDHPHYLSEVCRLARHPERALRRRAIFSLSRIAWPKDAAVPEEALLALEQSVLERDDEILSPVVHAALKLYREDRATEPRVTELIARALSDGEDNALHAASEAFAHAVKDLPSSMVDVLLEHLRYVKPDNTGTLRNIDSGIAQLLELPEPEEAIRFLQDFLLMHQGKLNVQALENTVRALVANKSLLGKVTTRWLLSGARVLCESVHGISDTVYNRDLIIDVDSAELPTKDLTHLTFVARKAIGYFFMKPITAASILISLMRVAREGTTVNHLGQLLFDPLLINYTGSARDYVAAQAPQELGAVKEALDQTLAAVDAYLDTLRGVPALPALHPSEAHREAHRRYLSQSTAASMEEARKHSAVLSLFSRSTLLYGRRSISYVDAGDGRSHRMEIPLQSHYVEMELPRMEVLDQFGLNYMLRVFRVEQLRA